MFFVFNFRLILILLKYIKNRLDSMGQGLFAIFNEVINNFKLLVSYDI